MAIRDNTLAKVQQLPESLLQEVSDFIDFISIKQIQTLDEKWNQVNETHESAVSDFSAYLRDLEQYEDKLARGEIQW